MASERDEIEYLILLTLYKANSDLGLWRGQIEYLLLLYVYKANSDLGWWRGEIEYLLLLYVYKANSDWPLKETKLSIYTQV